MNRIEKLTEYFSKLPGIGPRQSKRFVYFLLSKDESFLKELSENILNLKSDVNTCQSCYRFFQSKNPASKKECEICISPNRDDSVLMVVGKDTDLDNIEKNHIFNGKYFVLGGYFPILNKTASWVRTDQLFNEVEKQAKAGTLKEVILALSLNPEGENTIHHIMQMLNPLSKKYSFEITTLGKGLSTGTELEYSDDNTLKHALQNRK